MSETMTKTAQAAADRAEACSHLRRMFPVDSTVHTILRHVTQSGMSRSISVLVSDEDGIRDVSWLVARALGWKIDQNHGGVKVGGAGMDMGFHLIYTLAHTLYGNGYALNHRWI